MRSSFDLKFATLESASPGRAVGTFRSVLAGRRVDNAQIWRQRPRPDHFEDARRRHGRENRSRKRAGKRISLSFHRPVRSPGKAVSAGFESLRVSGRRALVVDDNATSRAMVADSSGLRAMVAETAGSGFEALAAMRRNAAEGQPYEVAIVDAEMPEMERRACSRNHIRSGAREHAAVVDEPGRRKRGQRRAPSRRFRWLADQTDARRIMKGCSQCCIAIGRGALDSRQRAAYASNRGASG